MLEPLSLIICLLSYCMNRYNDSYVDTNLNMDCQHNIDIGQSIKQLPDNSSDYDKGHRSLQKIDNRYIEIADINLKSTVSEAVSGLMISDLCL